MGAVSRAWLAIIVLTITKKYKKVEEWRIWQVYIKPKTLETSR